MNISTLVGTIPALGSFSDLFSQERLHQHASTMLLAVRIDNQSLEWGEALLHHPNVALYLYAVIDSLMKRTLETGTNVDVQGLGVIEWSKHRHPCGVLCHCIIYDFTFMKKRWM